MDDNSKVSLAEHIRKLIAKPEPESKGFLALEGGGTSGSQNIDAHGGYGPLSLNVSASNQNGRVSLDRIKAMYDINKKLSLTGSFGKGQSEDTMAELGLSYRL